MAGTTTDKLRAALASKESVRTAIQAKGVECGTDVPFADYGSKILSIQSGGFLHGSVGPGGRIFGVGIGIAGVGQYVAEERSEEIIE